MKPVISSAGYLAYLEFSGTIGDKAALDIDWYKYDRITPSAITPTTTCPTAGETADGNRNFIQQLVTSPSDARWAKLSPYRHTGTNAMYFHDCDLKEMLPAFYVTLSGNQSIGSAGATYVAFADDTWPVMPAFPYQFDATGDFVVGTYYFHPRSDGLYELDAMLRVTGTGDNHIPTYADIYDITDSTVIAVGPVAAAVTAAGVAHFPVHVGPVWLTNEMVIKVRYHALAACTILASGSWFSGRALL